MKSNGIRKNFTKLEAITTILPAHVINEVKPILRKQESDFTNNDAYLQLKNSVIRIFGPTQASHFQRAMGRVMSGKPSQLARAILDDMCDKELNGCCCHKWVFGLWHQALPTGVKQAVAHHQFSKETMEEVLVLADNVYELTRHSRPNSSSQVAAVSAAEPSTDGAVSNPSWPTDAQIESYAPEVAAIYKLMKSGGRGRGSGPPRGSGRGGRGGRGARGAANNQSQGQNQNQSQGQGRGGQTPRWKGPRHPDLPPFQACKKHWDWGKSAHWCTEPTSCPWKNFIAPRTNNSS